uniref:Uncharacterized protein n=1 Tax=Oryza meridionalis TaxID=40149 RepID=A0A0E0D3V6_9ORYZ
MAAVLQDHGMMTPVLGGSRSTPHSTGSSPASQLSSSSPSSATIAPRASPTPCSRSSSTTSTRPSNNSSSAPSASFTDDGVDALAITATSLRKLSIASCTFGAKGLEVVLLSYLQLKELFVDAASHL